MKLRVHGRNRFVTHGLLDEGEIADVTNHLYGSDGIARLQNGSDFDVAYEIAVDRTTRLRFRLNATPTRTSRHFGVNIVLRPIADMPPPLAEQHVEAGILEAYRPKNGMVLVGGSVGSGKSTLIAGMTVAKLLDPDGHYDIVEGAAPIEFLLEPGQEPVLVHRPDRDPARPAELRGVHPRLLAARAHRHHRRRVPRRPNHGSGGQRRHGRLGADHHHPRQLGQAHHAARSSACCRPTSGPTWSTRSASRCAW